MAVEHSIFLPAHVFNSRNLDCAFYFWLPFSVDFELVCCKNLVPFPFHTFLNRLLGGPFLCVSTSLDSLFLVLIFFSFLGWNVHSVHRYHLFHLQTYQHQHSTWFSSFCFVFASFFLKGVWLVFLSFVCRIWTYTLIQNKNETTTICFCSSIGVNSDATFDKSPDK